MKYVCALIVVEDMVRARDFYENVLGQKLKYDFGENIQYEGGFSLHLGAHYRRLLGVEEHVPVRAAHNYELYFETDALDETYDRLRRYSVRFLHELREQPWGQRVMRIYDPDENVIEIGESMEAVARRFHRQGMTPAEICRRTSLPSEFVAAALAAE
ncbi:MAG: VOC family protein [bacterium]